MTTPSFSTFCTKINTPQISYFCKIHHQSFQGRTASVTRSGVLHKTRVFPCDSTHYPLPLPCVVFEMEMLLNLAQIGKRGNKKCPSPCAHSSAEMLQNPGCCRRSPGYGSLSVPHSDCLSKQLSPKQRLEIRCLCCWFIRDLGILRMFWIEARLIFFQRTLTITLNWVRESPPGNHTRASDIKVALPACLFLCVWK